MPRMISTTASYGSPVQAMTIKALQERQAELEKQRAEAAAPQQMQSNWQGAAQMANSLVAGLKERQAQDQALEARQRLASIMAGGQMDPATIAETYSLDPTLGAYMLERNATKEDNAAALAQKRLDLTDERNYTATTEAARDTRELEQEKARTAEALKQGRIDTSMANQTAENRSARERMEREQFASGQDARQREAAHAEALRKEKIDAEKPLSDAAKLAEDLKSGRIDQAQYDQMMKPKMSDVAGIRQDIISDPSYKNIAQAAPIWSSIRTAVDRDTAQADLNIIIGMAKLFDPTSVVREGETETVKKTSSLPDNIFSQYKYLTGQPGSRLDAEVKKNLLTEGASRMQGYRDAYGQTSNFYRGVAERNRVDPRDIVPDFTIDLEFGQPVKTPTESRIEDLTGGQPTAANPQIEAKPKALFDSQSDQMPEISTQAEYDALPPGTKYKYRGGISTKKGTP